MVSQVQVCSQVFVHRVLVANALGTTNHHINNYVFMSFYPQNEADFQGCTNFVMSGKRSRCPSDS